MIHHSGTEDGNAVDWKAIRDYHVNHNHWGDIGYHFGCEWIGETWQLLIGRALTREGAHCPGMNWKAIGICIVGDYDLIIPMPQQLDLVVYKLIRPMMEIFKIPAKNIVRHKDFYETDCPGKFFDIDLIRRMAE